VKLDILCFLSVRVGLNNTNSMWQYVCKVGGGTGEGKLLVE
jgi:hypothetical protein